MTIKRKKKKKIIRKFQTCKISQVYNKQEKSIREKVSFSF